MYEIAYLAISADAAADCSFWFPLASTNYRIRNHMDEPCFTTDYHVRENGYLSFVRG